ncbi:MAG: hypothetical protein ACOX3J_11795 [Clostridia bacterium]|jgi:hypothetical protein
MTLGAYRVLFSNNTDTHKFILHDSALHLINSYDFIEKDIILYLNSEGTYLFSFLNYPNGFNFHIDTVSPVSVSSGDDIPVSIAKENDSQFFSYTPEISGMYHIKSSYVNDNIPHIKIYDDMWQMLVSKTGFDFEYALEGGKTYYFQVMYSGAGTGNYSFTVENAIKSTPISVNGSARVNIASVDEHKYFTFTLDESGLYRVYTTDKSGSSPDIYLRDSSWFPYLSGMDFAYKLAAGVTYYLDATCLSGTGSYTIHLEKLTTTEISVGDSESVIISSAGEHKYYSFTPDESGLYHVYTTDIIGSSPFIYLRDYSWGYFTNGTEIVYNLTSGTTYYLDVSCDWLRTGSFTIHIGKLKVTEISAGDSERISITTAGEHKYFAFTPDIGGLYRVFTTDKIGNPPSIFLYDSSWSSYTNGSDFVSNMTPGTTYYLDTYCSSGTGAFTIHLEKLNAIELSMGDSDRVNINSDGEHKYYKFTPDETGLYRIYTTDKTGITPYLKVHTESWNWYDEAYYGLDIVKSLSSGTTYYFDTYCLFDTGSYTIHLEKLNATELSLGDFDIVNIAYPDEHKYYKFIPDETGLYHVYTTDRSGGWPIVYLCDTSWSLYKNGSDFVYKLTAGETYYLDAYCASSETGSYNIHLEKYIPDVIKPGDSISKSASVNQEIWIKFVPEKTGNYVFYTTNKSSPTQVQTDVLDSDTNVINMDFWSGGDYNAFCMYGFYGGK